MAALKGVYVLGASAIGSSHTGSTTETTLATIAVPANAMGANGVLRITAQWGYSGGAGGWTPRIKFNGTSFIEPSAFANTSLSARQQTPIAIATRQTGSLALPWYKETGAPARRPLSHLRMPPQGR